MTRVNRLRSLGVSLLLCVPATANAQDIGPGNPDEVLECFADNKKSEACTFSCGTELSQGGGKQVSWGNVSQVEFYHKGNVGRADTRTWVFVAYKPGPSSQLPNVAALYIGPRYFCMGGTLVGGTGAKLELRFTKFNFN